MLAIMMLTVKVKFPVEHLTTYQPTSPGKEFHRNVILSNVTAVYLKLLGATSIVKSKQRMNKSIF